MVTLADLHLEDIVVVVVQGSEIKTVKKPHVVDGMITPGLFDAC